MVPMWSKAVLTIIHTLNLQPLNLAAWGLKAKEVWAGKPEWIPNICAIQLEAVKRKKPKKKKPNQSKTTPPKQKPTPPNPKTKTKTKQKPDS